MESNRAFLLAVIGLLLVLSALLVLPFIHFILAAVLLAFVLYPVHMRLSTRIGDTSSSLALVILSVIAIIVPLLGVMIAIADDALDWAARLREAEIEASVVEEFIERHTGEEIDIAQQVGSAVENVVEVMFGGALALFEAVVNLVIGIGLLLFLLFFLIRDGDRFVVWMRTASPLPDEVTTELTKRTENIVKAVLAGHVVIAVIQGIVAGIGLHVVGIPNVTFWTFVMILLALVPMIGTFLVWAPASVYLYLTGDIFAAIALFVYGVLVVSVSDEYLRPLVVDHFAEISPSVIVVGVIGGIYAFGFMGLFVGPIIVGMLKECVEVYDAYYGANHRVEGE